MGERDRYPVTRLAKMPSYSATSMLWHFAYQYADSLERTRGQAEHYTGGRHADGSEDACLLGRLAVAAALFGHTDPIADCG